ncbi:hypothetical protein MHYP_G00316660 [Metynnis hypsauchen]
MATRLLDAIPLRSITAKSVSRAVVHFCSIFGLPKTIQTDQGTNFTSKLFSQVLRQLNVEHRTSSAFHPESHGALEHFHQTLNTRLLTFCVESEKEWDDGIPLRMFALHEVVQESTGFSPAKLVFAHTVCGPLKLLKDQLLHDQSPVTGDLLSYVNRFCEKLYKNCDAAKVSLPSAQSAMKANFDKKANPREFKPCDKVLVLLPLPGSALRSKCSGPYEVYKKLSEVNYVISTPDHRRKHRVCHINMLKPYVTCESKDCPKPAVVSPPGCKPALVTVVPGPDSISNDYNDGLMPHSVSVLSAHLQNSELLPQLDTILQDLSDDICADLKSLCKDYASLFKDVPRQTNILKHDIDIALSPSRLRAGCVLIERKDNNFLGL